MGGAGSPGQPNEGVIRVVHHRVGVPVGSYALSESELIRLGQLRHQPDRDRFAVGATILRVLAGRELGLAPAQVVVDRTCTDCDRDHGPPRFAELGLWGSVAHSGRHVVVAVSTTGPVGIDVEDPRRSAKVAEPGFLRQVLAPLEAVRSEEWLSTWVRKEALLKLCGTGLRHPMSSLRLAPAGPHECVLVEPPAMLEGAIVRDLQLDQAVAAVASFGPPRVVCRSAEGFVQGLAQ